MSDLMSLEEIKERLKDRRLRVIASQIGVSYPTLKKLSDGSTDNFNTKTLRVVSEYLRNN